MNIYSWRLEKKEQICPHMTTVIHLNQPTLGSLMIPRMLTISTLFHCLNKASLESAWMDYDVSKLLLLSLFRLWRFLPHACVLRSMHGKHLTLLSSTQKVTTSYWLCCRPQYSWQLLLSIEVNVLLLELSPDDIASLGIGFIHMSNFC